MRYFILGLILLQALGVAAQNCTRSSSTYTNKYGLQSYHIPDASPPEYNKTPVVTLRVNFQVMQNDDGSGNFQDTPEVREFFEECIRRTNRSYAKLVDPIKPVRSVCGDCNSIKDARIQFKLMGVYFHKDSKQAKKWTPDQGQFGKNISSEINVYWVQKKVSGASGAATLAQLGNLRKVLHVSMFDGKYQGFAEAQVVKKDRERAILWQAEVMSQVLRHEFGHVLMLQHTYNSEITNPAHADYLIDVFGPSDEHRVSYHEGGWDCDLDPNNTASSCTNNFMGGSKGPEYLSPLQMGRMHRALRLTSLRNYIEGNPYSSYPLRISGDEVFDFDMRVFRDIVIEPNASLTLSCNLEMPGGGKIIVLPGGSLIMDGGTVKAAEGFEWKGVILRGRKKFLFFNRKRPVGTLEGKDRGTFLRVEDNEIEHFEKVYD